MMRFICWLLRRHNWDWEYPVVVYDGDGNPTKERVRRAVCKRCKERTVEMFFAEAGG